MLVVRLTVSWSSQAVPVCLAEASSNFTNAPQLWARAIVCHMPGSDHAFIWVSAILSDIRRATG